jgi:hypothetical protein
MCFGDNDLFPEADGFAPLPDGLVAAVAAQAVDAFSPIHFTSHDIHDGTPAATPAYWHRQRRFKKLHLPSIPGKWPPSGSPLYFTSRFSRQ